MTKLLSHCTNVQVIFSQGAKLHSFPNKLPRYILQEEWKVSENIIFIVISKNTISFIFWGKNRIYESILCNTRVRHKEDDEAVHLPFQERVHAF